MMSNKTTNTMEQQYESTQSLNLKVVKKPMVIVEWDWDFFKETIYIWIKGEVNPIEFKGAKINACAEDYCMNHNIHDECCTDNEGTPVFDINIFIEDIYLRNQKSFIEHALKFVNSK